ncbi:MAG: hypothetical protein U0984_01105, partial [Prosthecobacter sp.]|nr:hypothetical protein [Prosthecobacter sp.]
MRFLPGFQSLVKQLQASHGLKFPTLPCAPALSTDPSSLQKFRLTYFALLLERNSPGQGTSV